MSWASLRAAFPALSPAQLHRLLTQYQLASAMGPLSAWEPGPQDSPEAFQLEDVLESYEHPPPIVLPSEGFQVDLDADCLDDSIYQHLLYIRHFLWGLRSQAGSSGSASRPAHGEVPVCTGQAPPVLAQLRGVGSPAVVSSDGQRGRGARVIWALLSLLPLQPRACTPLLSDALGAEAEPWKLPPSAPFLLELRRCRGPWEGSPARGVVGAPSRQTPHACSRLPAPRWASRPETPTGLSPASPVAKHSRKGRRTDWAAPQGRHRKVRPDLPPALGSRSDCSTLGILGLCGLPAGMWVRGPRGGSRV